jgi:hypothetical protein
VGARTKTGATAPLRAEPGRGNWHEGCGWRVIIASVARLAPLARSHALPAAASIGLIPFSPSMEAEALLHGATCRVHGRSAYRRRRLSTIEYSTATRSTKPFSTGRTQGHARHSAFGPAASQPIADTPPIRNRSIGPTGCHRSGTFCTSRCHRARQRRSTCCAQVRGGTRRPEVRKPSSRSRRTAEGPSGDGEQDRSSGRARIADIGGNFHSSLRGCCR